MFLQGFVCVCVFVCRKLEGQTSNWYLRVGRSSLQEKSNEAEKQCVRCTDPLSSSRVRISDQCGRLMLPQEAFLL